MGATIVFIGDSITDCDRQTDPLALGSGYVDMVARTLRSRGVDTPIVNTGIAGDRVEHLRHRWQVDALDHAPALLSVFIGVNDTLGTFFQGRPTPLHQFEQGYVDLLDRAVAAGVPRLIVVEPFFVGSDDDTVRWREGNEFIHEDLAPRRAVVRALADRYGATFVALQEPMMEAVAARGRPVVAPDGIHPSPVGHQLIADRWLAAHDSVT